MTKATAQIPKDTSHKHKIVIPKEIWSLEDLHEGDFIEIDVKKIEKKQEATQLRA